MDATDSQSWFRKCACNKAFYKPNSFSNHIRSCGTYKAGVGSALESARAKYAAKKKSKKGKEAIESWYGQGTEDLDVDQDLVMAEAPVSITCSKSLS